MHDEQLYLVMSCQQPNLDQHLSGLGKELAQGPLPGRGGLTQGSSPLQAHVCCSSCMTRMT